MDPFLKVMRHNRLEVAAEILRFHDLTFDTVYTGHSQITRGRHPLVRFALWLGGFPAAGTRVPTRLELCPSPSGAIWKRTFGDQIMISYLWTDQACACVFERFGPIRVAMGLSAERGALLVELRALAIFGIPVPRFLLPKSETREFASRDGAFCFDVSATAPLVGPLIRYQGALWPENAQAG